MTYTVKEIFKTLQGEGGNTGRVAVFCRFAGCNLWSGREADRHKDEFLAMLAHELRNPLAPIQNAVQLMRLRPQPEPHWRRPLEVIERQLSQLTRLVDDLLDVSRITRGQINLAREPVELAATYGIEKRRTLDELIA